MVQEADELVGEAVERRDPSAAEIADENGVADLAKIARGPYDPPGSVEPVAVLEVADVLAGGCEQFDEAKAIAADGIVAESVLFSVGDEECAAYVLHVEGSEAARESFVFEGVFAGAHALEVRVVDFNFAGTDIRDIEESLPIDLCSSHAFV